MPLNAAHVAGVAVDTRHWIGGRRAESAATFTDVSPIDSEAIAEVARGGAAEVAAAVGAAGGVRRLGGAGLSGIGREGGTWSFDFYSDVKNTVYAGQGWSPDG